MVAALVGVSTVGPCGAAAAGPGATPHEVKPRETLNAIARRYGVSVREIVSANRLPGPTARLQPGSRLTIPDARTNRRGDEAPRASGRAGPQVKRASLRASPPREFVAPLPPSMLLGIPDVMGAPEFAWPVDGAVSSSFGLRWRAWHRGVDIMAVEGTSIHAAAAGIVVTSGIEPRYGRVVKIEHDSGFTTVYAHNLANGVDVGQRVAAGQAIGAVGQTGQALGPHLHFEIRHEGRAVNPLYLLPLPPRVATEEVALEAADDDE